MCFLLIYDIFGHFWSTEKNAKTPYENVIFLVKMGRKIGIAYNERKYLKMLFTLNLAISK